MKTHKLPQHQQPFYRSHTVKLFIATSQKELFPVSCNETNTYFHQSYVDRWSSQPKLRHAKETRIILIVAAAEFTCIGFTKLHKFSCLLNLTILQKTIFYEHRKPIVFPEIGTAWGYLRN